MYLINILTGIARIALIVTIFRNHFAATTTNVVQVLSMMWSKMLYLHLGKRFFQSAALVPHHFEKSSSDKFITFILLKTQLLEISF